MYNLEDNFYTTRIGAQHYADEVHIYRKVTTIVVPSGFGWAAAVRLPGRTDPVVIAKRPAHFDENITDEMLIAAIVNPKATIEDIRRYLRMAPAAWADNPPKKVRVAIGLTAASFTFADCLNWFGPHQGEKELALAKKMFSEHSPCSEFDLDDAPMVSMDDDGEGGYVLCWKWVPAK